MKVVRFGWCVTWGHGQREIPRQERKLRPAGTTAEAPTRVERVFLIPDFKFTKELVEDNSWSGMFQNEYKHVFVVESFSNPTLFAEEKVVLIEYCKCFLEYSKTVPIQWSYDQKQFALFLQNLKTDAVWRSYIRLETLRFCFQKN